MMYGLIRTSNTRRLFHDQKGRIHIYVAWFRGTGIPSGSFPCMPVAERGSDVFNGRALYRGVGNGKRPHLTTWIALYVTLG